MKTWGTKGCLLGIVIMTLGYFMWQYPMLRTPTGPASPLARPVSVKPYTAPVAKASATLASASHQHPADLGPASPLGATATPLSNPKQRLVTANGKQYPLRLYKTLAIPNDPSANQWWVSSTQLADAWSIGAGAYTPTVAIVDTGFALQHEEFSGRWYGNAGEEGPASSEAPSQLNCTDRGLAIDKSCNLIDDDHDGIVDNEVGVTSLQNPSRLNCTARNLPLDKSCNQIDDDGNGLVDDVRGWDFANFDNNVQAGEVDPAGSTTTHGTMVAGVFGATGNNSKGIAGVDWSAKIMPLQAIDDDGYGDTLTVARAVRYAADQGADIISLSLGTPQEDPYLREAIDYAIDKGSLIVAASGNDGCNCIIYPARYQEVLSVGAFNSSGSPASFSNYGDNLDIMAPGQDMASTTWSPTNPTSAYVSGIAGTSFATPFTSGLLALAKSQLPQASWGELVAALLESSDHRSSTVAAPHATIYGYGFVQGAALMSRVTVPVRQGQFYQWDNLMTADPLDTLRAGACAPGGFPATPVYELAQGSNLSYTASPLAAYRATQSGWSITHQIPSCVSLPIDSLSSVRLLNLANELHDGMVRKP